MQIAVALTGGLLVQFERLYLEWDLLGAGTAGFQGLDNTLDSGNLSHVSFYEISRFAFLLFQKLCFIC